MAQQKVSFKKWLKNITGTKVVKVGLFHIDLVDSIQYAGVPVNVTINGKTRCQGYIPTIVNKCGYYLKEHATQTRGIFRVSGSAKRVSELQIIFDTPPNYGSQLEWTGFTVHDASNVLRRYLNHLPDPVITLEYYEKFRDVHRNLTDDEEKIIAYQELISKLPPPHACLLMYLLDLLSIFAHHSEENLMDSKNLASVFQPGVISHPNHAMSPGEYMTSAGVLKFLIDNQSSFTMPKPNIDEDDEEMVNFGLGSPSQGRLPAHGPPTRGLTFSGGYVTAADHERIYGSMSGPGVTLDPEDAAIKRRLSLQRPIIPRPSLPGNNPQRSHSTTSSTSSHHSHSNVFSPTFIARRRSSRMSRTGSKLLNEGDLQAIASETVQDLSDIPENPRSAEDKVGPLQRTSSIRKASTSPVIPSEDAGDDFSSYLNLRKQLKSEGLHREPSVFCQTVEIQFPAPPVQTEPANFKPSPPTNSLLPPSASTLPPAPMKSPPTHSSERSKKSFGEPLLRAGRNIPVPSTTAHVHIPDRPLYQHDEGYIAPPPPSHHQEGPRLGLGLRRISGAGQSAQNMMSDHPGGVARQRHINPGMAIARAKSNPGDLVSTGSRNAAHGTSGGLGGGNQAMEKFKGLFSGRNKDHDTGSGKDGDFKPEKRRESLTDKQRKYKSQEVTLSQLQGTPGSGWRGPVTNQTINENDGVKPERPYVQPPPPIPRESPQRPAPPPPEGSLMDLLDLPQRIGHSSGYTSSSGGSRSGSPSHGASSRRALPTNSSFTSVSSASPTPSADRLYQGRGLVSQGSSASLEPAAPGDASRPPQRSPRNRYSPQFDSLHQGHLPSDHLQQQHQQHLLPYGSSRPYQHSGHSPDLGYDHEEGHPFAPPPPPSHLYDSSPRSRQGSFGSNHTYDSTNNAQQPPPPVPTPKSRERKSPREGSTSSFRGDATPPRARSNSSRNSSPVNSPSLKPLVRNVSHQNATGTHGSGGGNHHAPSPLAEGQGHGSGSGHYVSPSPSSRARSRAQSRDENHFLQRTDTGSSIGGGSAAQRSYERERSRSAAALTASYVPSPSPTPSHPHPHQHQHQQQHSSSSNNNSPPLQPLASFPNPGSPSSR